MISERRRLLYRVLDVTLALGLLLAMALGLLTAERLRRHLGAAQAAMNQLESTLSGGTAAALQQLRDPQQAATFQAALTTLGAELDELERLTRPLLPLASRLGWLPRVGGDLEAAQHLLTMAQTTTEAAQLMADSLLPLTSTLGQTEKSVGQMGPEVLGGLIEARPQMELAHTALAQAAESRARIDTVRLSSRIQGLVGQFDRYTPQLLNSLSFLEILPELLGADGPRTYLVLAQNNHELRATGGFISGVGLVQLVEGEISTVHFQDSYTVDDLTQPHPPAPDPLRRHMRAGMLVLRDANWWPDFPTSARAVTSLYEQDQRRQIDGVIAVDLITLQLLLQALGPVQVPGYEQAVSRDNLQSMVMSYWEAPLQTAPGKEEADWWQHRKDFASDLTAALLDHLMVEAKAEDLVELLKATSRALRERHLLVYVNNKGAQALLADMGWDGAIRPTGGDYLMVIDSNVGFNKVNPNVEQTIDYEVQLDGQGESTARLILSYHHRIQHPSPACIHESYYGADYADLMERCYWDYVRVYLPAGSEVLEVLGGDEPAQVYDENGRTVVATSLLLENGQARQVQISYRPELSLPDGTYQLLIQKQPGTGKLPVRVRVTPPVDVPPIEASPESVVWSDGQVVWQGDLGQDRAIVLRWK